MSDGAARRLRAEFPFRRVALVLSGGGAFGAYELGVLRVLEALRLTPAMIAGVSIGAVNAVAWVAHGQRTAPIEHAWRTLNPRHLGLRWLGLALRLFGALTAVLGLLEVFLTLAGSREMSGAYWIWKKSSARLDLASTQLDVTSWLVMAAIGVLVALLARPIEDWLARGEGFGDPDRGPRLLGRVALGLALVHLVVWAMGWPWPHRFSATAVLVATVTWLASGPGRTGHWVRHLALGLMPETAGRGLWSGRSRRRVIAELVARGLPSRLVAGSPELIVSALAVDTGRTCHFVNWPHPSDAFVMRVAAELGEVVPLRTAEEVISAAVASSAIPGVFEPERFDGRLFVDAGGFSNQPLHVVLANDADAVLVVLLTPSQSPPSTTAPSNVVELGGRLLELANWRDLQTELANLPAGWSRDGSPARVCVVEPLRPLPGGLLGFDPAQAGHLAALGEADAWRALEQAGWVERAT